MYLKTTIIFILSFLSAQVYADLGSLVEERERILKRIKCPKQSNISVGNKLGPLWGCYNRAEDTKLWINGQTSYRNDVESVKLMVINYHGSLMSIVGRIWGNIIAENYGGSHADKIKSTFYKCPVKKRFSGEYTVLVACLKGSTADEHMILVTSKS
jgi:hypothetical protein